MLVSRQIQTKVSKNSKQGTLVALKTYKVEMSVPMATEDPKNGIYGTLIVIDFEDT